VSFFSSFSQHNPIEFWKGFVNEFFAPNGVMKYALWNSVYGENRTFGQAPSFFLSFSFSFLFLFFFFFSLDSRALIFFLS